jgi:hypothetical protein
MILADDVREALRPQPIGQRVQRLFLEQRGHGPIADSVFFVTPAQAEVQSLPLARTGGDR